MESQNKWEQYECLHPQIVKAVYSQGLSNPTSIQSEVYENYKHYFQFLVASQTGSGKTLSFLAPIVSDLLTIAQNCKQLPPRPLCLILTPTRELALQISQSLAPLLPQTPLQQICILGGLSQAKQIRVLRQRRPHIIIGTPGRIHELLEDEYGEGEGQILNLEMLKFLVLDEADRMVEMGHYRELDGIMRRVFRGKVKEFFEKGLEDVNRRFDQMEKEQRSEFYIMQNGKKKKLNLNLNNFQTQKLFEVPMQICQISEVIPALESLAPVIQKNSSKVGKKNKQKSIEKPNKSAKKEKTKQSKKSVQKKKKKQQQNPQIEEEHNDEMKPQGEENPDHVEEYDDQQEEEEIYNGPQMEQQLTQEQIQVMSRIKRKVFFISATLTREFKGTKYFTKKKVEQDGEGKSKSKKSKSNNKHSSKQKQKPQQAQNPLIPKLTALLSRIPSSSKPKIIDQSSLIFLPAHLTQLYTFCSSDLQKFATILCYIKQLPPFSKIILFTNTIRALRRVVFFLKEAGLKTLCLNSRMMQKQRLEKMEKFEKAADTHILVCTDVAARGLDFVITNVIQFSVPVNGDTYVHRVGRTARANRPGQALILISQKQVNRWQQICDTLKTSSTLPHKYSPLQSSYDIQYKIVEEYEWIRLNTEKTENKRMARLNEEEAEEIGVEGDEAEGEDFQKRQKKIRRLEDFREEEEMRKCQVKRKIQEIQRRHKQEEERGKGRSVEVGNGKVWKKNKLVMTLDEIRKFL